MPEDERFFSRVDKTGTCWVWRTPLGTGYGMFACSEAQPVMAHRWSYEHVHGPIEPGMVLDHLCMNRACVRPSHLEPVTYSENARRSWQHRRGEREPIFPA